MPTLIGRCGGGSSLRSFHERVDSPSPMFTTSGTPRIINWSRSNSNDNANVAIGLDRLTTAGLPHVPVMYNGGATFVYTWTLTFPWAAFAGLRTVSVDVTDVAGVSLGQIGYPIFAQGSDSSADQWQNLAGIVIGDFVTFPCYLVVTCEQFSGVNQNIGSAAGLTNVAMLITAQEQS